MTRFISPFQSSWLLLSLSSFSHFSVSLHLVMESLLFWYYKLHPSKTQGFFFFFFALPRVSYRCTSHPNSPPLMARQTEMEGNQASSTSFPDRLKKKNLSCLLLSSNPVTDAWPHTHRCAFSNWTIGLLATEIHQNKQLESSFLGGNHFTYVTWKEERRCNDSISK